MAGSDTTPEPEAGGGTATAEAAGPAASPGTGADADADAGAGAAPADGPVGGVDLGASNLRAAVADHGGTLLARVAGETPQGDGERVGRAVVAALVAACEDAGVDPADLSAVGVGSIGPLDRPAGAAADPPNVPAERVPLAGPLGDRCDCPVFLHNDCVAAAIGERFYADAGPNLVYVTLSTGVGAGAIVDGRVLHGARGNAAEMGHVVVEPGGRACGCGGRGHWEAYAGGAAIPEFARELAERTGVSATLPLSDPDLDAATVLGADGPLVDALCERLAVYTARGLAATAHAFDPAVVAVGGAVARNHPDLLAEARDRLPDLLVADAPTVRLTDLGADAVLKGAVASALTGGTGLR